MRLFQRSPKRNAIAVDPLTRNQKVRATRHAGSFLCSLYGIAFYCGCGHLLFFLPHDHAHQPTKNDVAPINASVWAPAECRAEASGRVGRTHGCFWVRSWSEAAELEKKGGAPSAHLPKRHAYVKGD